MTQIDAGADPIRPAAKATVTTLTSIQRLQARLCPPDGQTDAEASWFAGYEAGYICGARHHAVGSIGAEVRRG